MSYGLCGASKEDRDYYELKQAAAEYYRSRNVPERLEEALNSTFFLSPEDVYGHLANYFAQFSKTPIICSIRGKKVLDGTGKATVEVEVLCTVKNTDKSICSSVLSAHSELPYLASSDALEASEEERIKSVDIALEWIKDSLSPLLKGMPPNEQCNIDKLLSEYLKPKIEEENERTRIEKEEREAAVPPVISLPPPAAPPKSAKKKGSGKGKKTAAVEKPIPPEDPPETTIRGSLAIGGVSLALAKASAIINNTPLYLHIASLKQDQLPTELAMPIPMITLLSYGKSSPGKLNLMKEVLVFPKPGLTMQQSVDMAVALQKQIVKQIDSASKTGSVMKNVSPLGCLVLGCDRVDQPLDLISEACEHLGLELGTNLHLAINCAAHELMDYNKGKYEVVTGTFKSPDEMVDMYVDVISRHPAVVALIDPLRKEDALQWQSMGTTLGSRCYLIADVASKSVSNLLINRTVKIPMSSGIVIKNSNETTVSDLMEVFRLVEGEKHVTVLGCKYEESIDDSLVDLAVGLGARFIKLGGLLRGERTTKYNRLLAIEEGLTQNGTLGKQPEHEFPVLCNDIQSPTSQEEEQRLKCVQTEEKPGGAHI
ncbi:enolase 4 [Ascaphus truei]|uniref:enolase 4 n=1 Tax=Ascaphus truei TaxID=8439 RepID=UPI003F59378B